MTKNYIHSIRGFPGGAVVKNLPINGGDTGDWGSIPWSGRYPGEGNDNLPGKCHRQRSLASCPWGHKDLGMTEHIHRIHLDSFLIASWNFVRGRWDGVVGK